MKKFIFLILLSSQAFAEMTLAPAWINETATKNTSAQVGAAFDAILDAQGRALDGMETGASQKALPFGFRLTELTTDLGATKQGLFGISALRSYNGVEIKWKKVQPRLALDESEAVDIVVDEDTTEEGLTGLTDSIVKVVEVSGKVKDLVKLRTNVRSALETVHDQVRNIDVTTHQHWRARSLRLDLNFGVSGQVWFFARAGVTMRLRMEWNLKERALLQLQDAVANPQTKFVVKTLVELNQALEKVQVAGFEPKKVFIGVGASQRKQFFGLWRYNAGFVGWLGFVPVTVKSLVNVEPPLSLTQEDFFIGEGEEPTDNKGWWPFRRHRIPARTVQSGLEKSVRTAAFFAEHALASKAQKWRVTEIKTVNDISKSGFFGLADVSTRGVVEIDFKRN